MPTPTAARSIDALIADDPAALDLPGLKANLLDFAVARARFDAAEAATIAEFDQRGAFLADGQVNTRAWLAHHTGIARNVAGGRILTAKRLRRMPLMAAALADGRVTNGHATALGRCLKPRTLEAFLRDEAILVERATRLEVDDFQQAIARWIELNDEDGPDPGDEKPSELYTSPILDGRTRLDGELDLEDSAEYLAELETIYDELWHADQNADPTDPNKYRTPAQRRAAAQVEMARRSSAAGDRDSDPDDPAAPRKRGPRKPQLLVIVDVDALEGNPTGEAHLDNGVKVPVTTLERWACDSSVGRVVMQGKSVPLDVGTITYTATDGQRRALAARDRSCIVPGCKRKPRWCEAHHVVPWPQGPTNIKNLVLLCKRHHKMLHAHYINIVHDNHTDQWIVDATGWLAPSSTTTPHHPRRLSAAVSRGRAVATRGRAGAGTAHSVLLRRARRLPRPTRAGRRALGGTRDSPRAPSGHSPSRANRPRAGGRGRGGSRRGTRRTPPRRRGRVGRDGPTRRENAANGRRPR